jgi:hypothetical protein
VLGLAALMVAGLPATAYARPTDGNAAGMAIVLVLDNSGSYTLPGRESLATYATAARPPAQMAVVVFDATARVALPLGDVSTPERKATFDSAVTSVDRRGQNTVLNAGLETAVSLLSGVDSTKSDRHIVFFSDGVSDPPRHLNRDSLSRDWERLVSGCATAGIKVSVVCPPDTADLQGMAQLASATNGLCIVAREPARAVGAILGISPYKHGPRPSIDGAPLPNAKGKQWRTMFFLAALLLLAAAGTGAVSIVRGRAARRRSLNPTGMEKKEGLVGLADAVEQLRALATGLGEPGKRIGDLAAAVEAAGDVSFSEQRATGDRMRKLLGEVMATRDEVEDVLGGLSASDKSSRENLEFVDELLARVLASAGVREMTITVGTAYDSALHEPLPERGGEPRGTVLRVVRRGYISLPGSGSTKVLRFAKVSVSDGITTKEA